VPAVNAKALCPEDMSDGIYVFNPENNSWKRDSIPVTPIRLYLFTNAFCVNACNRALGIILDSVGELIDNKITSLSLIVCTRFRHVCNDDEARELFIVYDIFASPSVVVIINNKVWASIKGSYRIQKELNTVLSRLRGKISEYSKDTR
jgi:hypothetical protein